jgi:two-component system cell cycle sensor histidine kinase/response regulator CckA
MDRTGKEPSVARFGRRHWLRPWAVAVLGTLLSLVASGLLWQAERRREEAEFRRHMEGFRWAFQEHRTKVQDLLLTLRALLRLAPGLTEQQFNEAIDGLAIRSGGVQAFIWAPWIEAGDRTGFETRVRSEGVRGFQILEGDITHPKTDRPVPASGREAFLPVRFLSPLPGNEAILGYDLLSLKPFDTHLLQARDNGNLTVSPPLPIPYRGGVLDGFVVALPVYRPTFRPASVEQRRAEFRGCVIAGFVFQEVMEFIGRRTPERRLDILLVERSADGKERVLYQFAAGQPAGLSADLTLEAMKRSRHDFVEAGLPERAWRFYFRPGANWSQPLRFWSPFSLLLAGLLVTATVGLQLAGAHRRALGVERLVAERTSELGSTNLRLVDEVRERQRAERTLEHERNLLRTLLDRLPDAVFVCDSESHYRVVNDVHLRLLGVAREEEALGRLVKEVGPSSLARALDGGITGVLATGEPELFRELTLGAEAEKRRHFSVSRLPLPNPEGAVDRVLVLVRDVTEARRAEAERQDLERHLQETQKLESLGLLAGGIAHDFNNLLTTALGNVGLARMDLPPGSPVTGPLDQIEAMTRRAADLCRQLLAYSGRGRFSIGLLDLNRLIRETNELIRLSVSKKVAVHLELAPELPAVSGDATQLRQVLMNLVMNAAEAIGDRPGEVRLRTSVLTASRDFLAECTLGAELEAGEYVAVEVDDDGSGMAADTVARIFDPFFTTKFLGRGLGLAAVLGITRSHRGAIQVDSVPGTGTTFRLLLPRAAGAGDSPANAIGPMPVRRGEGTILVVDDEETVRVIAARILQRAGFEVVLAVDGKDGVDRFVEAPDRFRAVVLDLTMPQLNGEEVFRELRRVRPEVRVLLMSGFTSDDAGRRFAGLGLNGFLEKPFGTEELLRAVEAMLADQAPTVG